MACLNKLAIRGIRSFDDKQISVIEFFTPVTVIVGPNGSGKTTVIECLKYATTGDQPPNTRGGAFVHDPKMANEKEVKAQVKLRFHAANGQRMLAVRNLSVTMKKNNAMTMKTLESILALADGNTDKGGKRGVISTKCAEIDTEIPHLLGVSKSVLENVIFCHQEDSYWPLAEPSVLKKKFDDIFEATRYTKALDAIKSLRKDRVAELKAEKERLESLSREKAHADKLKSRISDLNSTIASKEIEYEETKRAYEELVVANKKFYDGATKFREMYAKIGSLEETKARFNKDLEEARENCQEFEGTDDQLKERLANFEKHLGVQKQKRRQEESTRQDLEDDLRSARKSHVDLVNEHGRLSAEQKAHEQRVSDREELIRTIAGKYQMKGYDHSPLEKEKVADFISRLEDLVRQKASETEKLQSEVASQNKEYQIKSKQLVAEVERLKQEKSSFRNQISSLQSSISSNESILDASQSLAGKLRTVIGDIEEKKSRLEKLRQEIRAANYDERMSEKSKNARTLEDQREALNAELRSLSLQADSRARLDIKRTEMKTKETDVKNVLEVNNAKFRKLTGVDAKADTMEREVDRALSEKEREHVEQEGDSQEANGLLQKAETTLSTLNSQLKAKQEELKGLEKKLKEGLDLHPSVEEAMKEASEELNLRKEMSGTMSATSQVWDMFLKTGKTKKICKACNRDLDDHEMPAFEKYVKDQMKKTSPESIANNRDEMAEWDAEVKRLQALAPAEASRNRLKDVELPKLERQIKEQEAEVPPMSAKVEASLQRLNEVKRELRELATMKQQATHVSRNQKDVDRLRREIAAIEDSLSSTGSTKTPDDVQAELDSLSTSLRANERERQTLMAEKERQQTALRSHESGLHSMQLEESELRSQLREKEGLEARTQGMKKEIEHISARLKEMDDKISAAQAPVDQLESDHQLNQKNLHEKLTRAQQVSQDLNMSSDKLESISKAVDRYVRDKRGRYLMDCEGKIEGFQARIQELVKSVEEVRDSISNIDKELGESAAVLANLRENDRIRRLVRDIAEAQAEIDSFDMEAAAKSRRLFDDKYKGEKEREANMQSKYAHIGGELSSHKSQLKTLETDLKEFKNVNKKYTDQLVKVKMSDMANSDLEKYAKALDNAIMKYHSLKMEEVNDTMRHLWNKTYQGTDIDGIKIRSDNEGGTTKRTSYNYRVVMTKDQVEMDMRGRCSAGQKMLASIIIRLALSDSFGQNCGILALDEPTNALDIENIDALAASLVDIINERKNHSNFQLIIITHDENFLRKLGQCDVMEYYW
ncbi:hypothetical protein JAAARDRAFT_66083 [Jaapia argillacea MUCL 33604]|uniref:DNA repair protein RAD50 n=1 Tax=Jaapia argillacea MUCL 33604 TaxID=933084 RepID=A0A067QIA4_9AGAM|nr:hypothetical protein JAAARDRAFT_66083 [Jaapia argillacea MUCL 33604]